MREIKFQGKRLDNGEWVYGCLTKYSENMSYITVDLIENKTYQVYTATVGQYTGLKDKNGVEGYEHDIVKDRQGQLFVIRWNEHWGAFCLAKVAIGVRNKKGEPWYCSHNPIYSGLTEYEIVGNLHDTPDLLTGLEAAHG